MIRPALPTISSVILLVTFAFFSFPHAYGQETAEEILQAMAQKMNRIDRFEAEARIEVDIDFIDIKDRFVKITYQYPDQFTFDSKGLSLLPKNGMQMEYLSMLNQDYTAILMGTEMVRNTNTRIIKVIPESEDSDIILAQLWIDDVSDRIIRMKTFTRKSGSYIMDFEYRKEEIPLPDRLVVSFEISNMILPTKAMSELMSKGIQKPDSIPKKARVIVEYSNYKIVEKEH